MAAALITGASSGIGLAIAGKLAGRGFDLALVARDRGRLEAAAGELRKTGVRVVAIAADVSDAGQMEGAVTRAVGEFQRMDVLVNNAGYAPSVVTHAVENEEWRKILDVNLSSGLYATRAVWPVMARQHEASGVGGVIVNISSIASRDPFPGLGAYAIAKVGVNMLTQVTAQEGAAVGIRVFGIAPGAVETPMLRGLFSVEQLPLSATMRPEEIAGVALAMVDGTLGHASGETLFLQKRG